MEARWWMEQDIEAREENWGILRARGYMRKLRWDRRDWEETVGSGQGEWKGKPIAEIYKKRDTRRLDLRLGGQTECGAWRDEDPETG